MKYLLIGLLFFFSQTLYSGLEDCGIVVGNYNSITFMNSNGTTQLPIEELYMVNFRHIDYIDVDVQFLASLRLDSELVDITNRPIVMIYVTSKPPRQYYVELYVTNKWDDSELEPCEIGEIEIN